MKKIVHKEVSFCDVCGKECSYAQVCLNCGKEFCYECLKTEGVKYKHSVWFSGTGDGTYCNECDSKLKTSGNKLHTAYRKIVSLSNECEDFCSDFKKRADEAEANVMKELGRDK